MGRHTEAAEMTLAAAGEAVINKHRALSELVRTLAEQCDASGPEGPGTRLAGTYLTALRTLNSTVGTAAAPGPHARSPLASVRGIRNGATKPF